MDTASSAPTTSRRVGSGSSPRRIGPSSPSSCQRISMNLSSRSDGVEPLAVAHHGPQHVHSASGKRNQGLAVLLALRPLAVVESPARLVVAQAGEGGAVEDALEQLVAAAHPAAIADPLA